MYAYGLKGAPAVGGGLPGLPRREAGPAQAGGRWGEVVYSEPGEYELIVPGGVSLMSLVVIGGGSAGEGTTFSATSPTGLGGAGGALVWLSGLKVSPGDRLSVVNAAGGSIETTDRTPDSSFVYINDIEIVALIGRGDLNSAPAAPKRVAPNGGDVVYAGHGINLGGSSGQGSSYSGSGGGGAAGYTGRGGRGGPGAVGNGLYDSFERAGLPPDESSGGAAGGSSGRNSYTDSSTYWRHRGTNGGGTSLYGLYPLEGGTVLDGVPVAEYNVPAPSPLTNGSWIDVAPYNLSFGAGGGGRGSSTYAQLESVLPRPGGNGGIRIVWGSERLYPYLNVGTSIRPRPPIVAE